MKLPAISLISILTLLPFYDATAVEVLSAKELASHCQFYSNDSSSVDGEFCARYIQGFIDGAVATDARVMLNVEDDIKKKESFRDRVMRTRVLSRVEYRRAASYAEFCLGDPVLLKEVVVNIVNYLQTRKNDIEQDLIARNVVYESLKKYYPCEAEKNK